MNIEDFRMYCLSKKGVTEEFPFDKDTLVFKVMGKMFALTSLNNVPFRVNLKCDPELVEVLREEYEEVSEGYHMNKRHWNTIEFESISIETDKYLKWIDRSYDLVIKGLKKSLKEELASL